MMSPIRRAHTLEEAQCYAFRVCGKVKSDMAPDAVELVIKVYMAGAEMMHDELAPPLGIDLGLDDPALDRLLGDVLYEEGKVN
jgi:hypothetical protein